MVSAVAYWSVLGWYVVLYVLIYVFVLWTSVFVHELGHCYAAIKGGGEVESILLWPLGGLAQCCPGDSPKKVPTHCGVHLHLPFHAHVWACGHVRIR